MPTTEQPRRRSRPLPASKSLGTAWNLRPATERVNAADLRTGDVVLESDEHPVRITRATGVHTIVLLGRYVWQADTERPWLLGTFRSDHPFDRAKNGEY